MIHDTDQSLRRTYLAMTIILGKYANGKNITPKGLTIEGLYIRTIEGYYAELEYLQLRHCGIGTLYINQNTTFNHVFIDHCIIGTFYSPRYYSDFNISNCVVGTHNPYTSSRVVSNTMSITNSYIGKFNAYDVCYLNNCVINGDNRPNASCTAHNCVVPEGLLSNVLDKEGNYEVSDVTSLFVEDYTSNANYYKLTDEAASTYLGQDGTQVGIYGGLRPYTPIHSHPRVVEKSIAGQTTANGKLRVYVKAEARSY